MRLSTALRRVAVVAATTSLLAGAPLASPAFADEAITNVTPTGAANTTTRSVQFDVGADYLPAPKPTVTFVRQADEDDTIEVDPTDVTVSGQHFTVIVDLTRRNPGPWNILVSGTVITPAPGTVVSSCTGCFEVLGFTPAIGSIAPTSLRITASATNFTITGTNFTDAIYCVSGDCTGKPTVTVSGTGLTLASSSAATATTIPLTITAPAGTASGFRDITVTNTDGKTDTCENCLLITPNVASVAYPANSGVNNYGQGAVNRRLTITGHGFQPAAVVSFATNNGINILATDVVDANTINVDVTLNQNGPLQPSVGNHAITVTNPDGGAHVSTVNFSIVTGPTVTSVVPGSRGRGETVTLTINGTGFATSGGVTLMIPDVVVNSYSPTINATNFTVNATLGSGALAGPRDVTVMNNSNKGQFTCQSCFTIDNLQVNTVSPNNVLNDAGHTLTITGSNFAADATVKLVKTGTGAGSVADIPGTSVVVNGPGTSLTASFATTGAAPGTWAPRVTNPTTNAGTGTCTCSLNVAAVTLDVTSVSPTSRGAGAQDQTIEINGTGFAAGATVTFSNPGVHVVGSPTITATKITVVVNIDGNATPDDDDITPPTPTVTVTNTDEQTDSADFRVNPAPSVEEIDKPARAKGTSTTITISGEDFVDGATVVFGGLGVTSSGPWTFTAGNGVTTMDELSATVDVASDAASGPRSITVVNPDGGRGTCTCTLTVDPQPTVTSVVPSKVPTGATTVVTVNGTGFNAGATVTVEGTGVTANVTQVTPTALTVSLVVTGAAARGLRDLTVNNTDGGQATLTDAFEVYTIPGAPGTPTATRGTGSATVTWTAPADDGGEPLTGYTVTASPGGATSTVDGTTLTTTVNGLTNGTSYTFTVFATNGAGNGPASAASNAVTPATVPDPPTGVTAVAGNAQATVSWTAPSFNGGDTISGYTVTSSPGGLTTTVNGTTLSGTVTGLTNGTEYTFTVVATNAIGNSTPSSASNPVTPSTVPGAPTAVTATAGNASATVSWTAPSTGGSAITGYTVTSSPGGHTGTADGSTTSTTVSGLTNGTEYTFTVVASNTNGPGPASSASNAVTPFTNPAAPTGVAATAGAQSAHVTWVASSTNGSAITGYTVTSSPGGITETVDGTTLEADVTGLTPNTSYTFTVVATNAAGNSVPSSPSNSVTPFDFPGKPTGVTATRGNTSASVSWVAPASNGGSTITGYTVTASPGGATSTVNGVTLTATVTGLTNGTSYTFTVVATNAGGNGAASDSSNAVTPAGPPLAPPTVTATAGHATATVTWTAPSANGSPITSYTVTASPGGATQTVTTLTATFSGLTNGVLYTFAVQATNTAGTGTATISNGVRPTWVTKLTEGASTQVVATNSARVYGKLTRSDGVGISGASIAIYRKVAPATTFTFVRTVTTGAGGAWSTTFTMTKNTYFQARFAGATGFDPTVSPSRLTLVRYRVTATYSRVNRTLTVKGSVSPNAAGRTVFLRRRTATGGWATVAYGKVAANGTYSLTRTLAPGTYSFAVFISTSPTNYTGNSLPRSVTIP